MPATEVSKTDRDYEVEEAARTLLKAEEIKQDKKLYSAALKEMKRQQSALSRALGEGKSLREVLKG